MSTDAVAAFVQALQEHDLLDPVKLAEAEHLASFHTDVRTLAKELIQRNSLTTWQAQMIIKGRVKDLFLGSYLLLDELGKGGMGKVYKAQHRLMGRIVALKIIKKKRLGDPEAIRRFQREIQSAAKLSHPNVVRAFDADQQGDFQYFAMEFVDGIDLGRLVKENGPLPLREACEYVRQAALGLQHAHEHGLVHRDIKPSNLLLTLAKAEALRASLSGSLGKPPSDPSMGSGAFEGVIKISDLGVARVRATKPSQKDPSKITHVGLVLGTPDFLAPEQARNASKVDIRADLYSLGCTLFFLLTGKSPFPDGTPTEKLLMHALDSPPDVRTLRTDAPAEVAAIVDKLLAKAPENRYQTPMELAIALEPYSLDQASAAHSKSYFHFPMLETSAATDETASESNVEIPLLTQQRIDEERRRRGLPIPRRMDWGLWIPLALGTVLLIAGLAYMIGSRMK